MLRHLQEVDFEGRPFRSSIGGAPTVAAPTEHGECYLVFTGLERTGHDLGSLNVTALFGMDGTNQIATVTSPLQARCVPVPTSVITDFPLLNVGASVAPLPQLLLPIRR